MTILLAAGPFIALLLAGALATRALVIAGGPDVAPRTRGLSIAIVVLAAACALSIALRLLAGA